VRYRPAPPSFHTTHTFPPPPPKHTPPSCSPTYPPPFPSPRRFDEALALYEEGCTATGGTNAHIWTAWAYLAARRNDVALARKLYDAAIVADKGHAAAWHGWGMLEKAQGDYLRARDLWTKVRDG
jgi:hypothetical protein